jgi:hypothetical protein
MAAMVSFFKPPRGAALIHHVSGLYSPEYQPAVNSLRGIEGSFQPFQPVCPLQPELSPIEEILLFLGVTEITELSVYTHHRSGSPMYTTLNP